MLAVAVSPVLAADDQACWGQATAAFAATGEMGEHASGEETPRLGLGNLADVLYENGTIDAPTLQALGAWLVSLDPELVIDECM